MPVPQILKNFKVSVLGQGYAGVATKIKLPELTLKTVEVRGAGMDAPIDVDVGLEKLEAEFTFNSPSRELLALFGSGTVGIRATGTFTVVLPGGVTTTPAAKHVTLILAGLVKKITQGEWQVGDASAETVVNLTLSQYQYIEDGIPVHNISVMEGVRVINGVDQNAAQNLN